MRLCALVLWCVVGQPLFAAECPAQLRMAYNASWLPYVEVTDEAVKGQDIDLIRGVVEQVGSRLQLQFVPEKRAMQMLQLGQVDMLFAASYTEARAGFAWFSHSYRKEYNVVLVHRQALQLYPELARRDAFLALAERKLVGVYNPAGFYGDAFEQVKQLPAVRHRSLAVFEPERRLELVFSQRADYTIVDRDAVQFDLRRHPDASQFQVLPFYLNEAEIHLMLSKASVAQSCVSAINAVFTAREKMSPGSGRSVLGSD